MDLIWKIVSLVSLALLLQAWLMKSKSKSKRLPPSPRGFPIIGHLHLLGKNPHQDLYRLAKKHGPVMCLRFGFVPNIIVSSPEAAEWFLKTHDLVFAGRPPHQAAKYLSYDQRNLIFGQYGPYWRDMRKLCTLELLSSRRICSFQAMRREELSLFVRAIRQASEDGVAVDLSAKVATLNSDMSCRMIFGKKCSDKDLQEGGRFEAAIKEAAHLTGIPNLGDYFPYLGVLDLQGLTRRLKTVAKILDEFLEKIIDEHIRDEGQGLTKDFVHTMMSIMESGETEFKFDRRQVKAIMLDMLAASMDTSAAAIEWVLSELLRHPWVLKKLQEELEKAVGLDRMVEESDLGRLKYLDMVLKEAFRLHPAAPLLIPHQAMEDCTVNGFHIPKNSRVIVNAWAIGRDPNAWTEPEKFIPERFAGSSVDLRGQHFQLLPFGSGRRSCPGMQLGLTVVRLVVAQLVHCFDWDLHNDRGMLLPACELDMAEEFGAVIARTNHLMAIPTYRLHTNN